MMDFQELPFGFGLSMAQNELAMVAYASLAEAQKQAVLAKAHAARSRDEMQAIVSALAEGKFV